MAPGSSAGGKGEYEACGLSDSLSFLELSPEFTDTLFTSSLSSASFLDGVGILPLKNNVICHLYLVSPGFRVG